MGNLFVCFLITENLTSGLTSFQCREEKNGVTRFPFRAAGSASDTLSLCVVLRCVGVPFSSVVLFFSYRTIAVHEVLDLFWGKPQFFRN